VLVKYAIKSIQLLVANQNKREMCYYLQQSSANKVEIPSILTHKIINTDKPNRWI